MDPECNAIFVDFRLGLFARLPPHLRCSVRAPLFLPRRTALTHSQAFPGPNFNFAVALGYLAVPSLRPIGAIMGYLGIFSPGIILKLGLLPFYSSWRENVYARSILRGVNAAASGLVYTAVWQLFLVGYIYQPPTGDGPAQTLSGPLTADPFWAVVASGSFISSRSFKAPPWLSIAGGGLAGLAWYGVQTSKG